MKRSHPWHDTPFGKLARWLGSIQLAVPVLALVALSLAYGTYLESTRDAKVSRALVYGSWWFMALMALVCVSLIFAAVVRFPWKRKHTGFLIVHASLVSLIVGGFWSLLGRVEGHLGLEQGNSAGAIELAEDQIELLEHDAGQFRLLGTAEAPTSPGSLLIGGYPIQIADIWSNVREEFDVTDDGPAPYRAIQVALGPSLASAVWVGDEARGAPPVIDGVTIRVLAAGLDWAPPPPPKSDGPAADASTYSFFLGDKRIPLAAQGQRAFEGQPALEGWTVKSITQFLHASVGPGGGLIEDPAKPVNPGVEVIIIDGKGSTERHTAFEQFADMILVKSLEGSERSGARLGPSRPVSAGAGETLVLYGEPPALRLAYIGRDGAAKLLEHGADFPWAVDLGSRRLTIVKQYTKANELSRFVQAPPAKDMRSALVIKTGDSTMPLAWKAMLPINLPGRVAMLRYGPKTVSLPFAIRLDQFRKTDYPGTDMAMSYESDVTVTLPSAGEQKQTISMNNPLVQAGWKVYQSGFVGDRISVFSVMRDPGLILTYISCTALCLGIAVTFYGRGLSWGHPGIPTPFSTKEHAHASPPALVPALADPRAPVARGGPGGPLHDAVSDRASAMAGTTG